MFNSNTKNIFIITVIFLLIQEGLTIKCWECTSEVDSACADPFNNSTMPLTNCDFNTDIPGMLPSVCVKVIVKGANGPIIKRSCGYEFAPNDNNCTSRYIPFFEKPEICVKCKEHGCNSANSYKLANITFIFISLLYIFIK